jgi:hypothetical protein
MNLVIACFDVRNAYEILVRKHEGSGPLERPGEDGRMILK